MLSIFYNLHFSFFKYSILALLFTFQCNQIFSQENKTDSITSIYEASDFIFIGKVKGINDLQQKSKSVEKKIIADIDVIEIYKGRRWNKVMVVAEFASISIEKEYLFYGIWGKTTNKKGKIKKAGYFNLLHLISSEKDNALPEIKKLVKIIKQKTFGRIKSPRAKIILRKCGCSEEKL